jgi:glycosyltransferase involved in cell wall biosynthesis
MDDLEKFVAKTYLAVLERPADPSGLKVWVDMIRLRKIKKEDLVEELKTHQEYKNLVTLKNSGVATVASPGPRFERATATVTGCVIAGHNIDAADNRGRKVAFIMENFNFYSGGRYLSFMIAIAFQEIGFDVTLFTDKIPSEIPYINNDDFKEYKKPRIEYVPDLNLLSLKGYDMYVGAPTDGCVIAHREAIKNKKPYIAFLFDVPPFMKKYSDLDKGWVNHPIWENVSQTLKDADLIFTFAKLLIPYIREFGKLESINKIKVFHPPINSRVCEKSPGGAKKRQIFMANRFAPNKHWDHLFEAVSKIKNPPRIIAITSQQRAVNELAMVYNIPHLVDYNVSCSDSIKFKLIKESLAVINPSSYEGLSMSASEATVSNTPCILYEFPIMTDIFGEKGMIYAKYLDPEDLKGKIELILENEHIRAAKEAEAMSVGHLFTFDNFTEELFEELFICGLVERSMR